MNLAFYSDQIIPENELVDRKLLAVMASKKLGRRIGYIPSGPEPDRRYFQERAAYYARYGLDLCVFYDLDEPHLEDDKTLLLQCDAIHLSGGHTGGFLARLRRSGMIQSLKSWATNGGLLIGTSAGAILLTPTIATDALFTKELPEDRQHETALDLVPFEFFPHLNAHSTFLPALIRYSRYTSRPIIACNDGDGLVVTNGDVCCIGRPLWIEHGEVHAATDVALSGIGKPTH